MPYKFSFEKLEAWQESRSLAQEVYNITEHFPKKEVFGLTSQIRRSIVSVPSNLAEGTGRQSLKDQARFSEMAYSSLMEAMTQLIMSCDMRYINEAVLEDLRAKTARLANKITGLRNSQLARAAQTQKTINNSTINSKPTKR